MSTPVVDGGTVTVLEDSQDSALGLAAPTDADLHPLTITVAALPDPTKGVVTLASGLAVTVGQELTATQLQGLQYDAVANFNGPAGSFVYSVSDGTTTVDGTVVLEITPVNDAPTITGLSGDTVLYTGLSGPIVIEQGGDALVADLDSANFAGGQLTVSITSGGDSSADVLSIVNQGTGTGQIGLSGTSVTYEGVLIGTLAGGSGGAPLVVTLTADADAVATTALVRAITYEHNSSGATITGPRTVGFTLSDGDGDVSAPVSATVTVAFTTQGTLDVRVSANNDDAEERISTGAVSRNSSDLELSVDGSNAQLVGLRFNGIAIPQGATITKAYIQFQVDEASSGATSLTIQGQASATADQFDSARFDISSRPTTLTSVAWQPEAWPTVGAAGTAQQSPDLSAIIQEIIDQGGWISGNSLAILIGGTGTRTAESYNGVQSAAPLLHIEFTTIDPTPNTPPVVDSKSVTVLEDAQDNALGLAAPTDADLDPLTITVAALPDPTKGTVTLASGVAVTVGQVLTATQLQGLQYDAAANANGAAGSFVYSVFDGSATVDGTVTLGITPVNDAPTIAGLAGDASVYTTFGGAVVIEQGGNALVADVDSADFASGQLTVSIAAGGDAAEDVLSILNQGTDPGQIGLSGTDVTYGGVLIGTLAGGTGGAPLVVTLTAAANAAATTALVRAITYKDIDTVSPTLGARTIDFQLTDGDGGTSATFGTTVSVSAPNTPPVVDSKSVTVLEDAQDNALGLAAPTDADGNPMTITVVSLPDPTKGTVTLASGVAVTVGQVLSAAQLQGLQFDTAANANGAAGSFVYSVFDGITTVDGTVVLNITPVNDAPTIAGLAGDALAYTTYGATVVIEQGGNALVADVDSADFAGGQLTVTISAGSDPAEDVLSILNQGTGAGQIGFNGTNVTFGGTLIGTATGGAGGTPLVVTLTAAANAAATTALVRAVTYRDTDTASPT
ncbi:MAG: hypothetical protein E4H18_00570, partial [Hyphomicrobiales bacterium]